MRLDLNTVTPATPEKFDYVRTNFDNGTTYGVWYGGAAPLNGGGGRYIGDVARADDAPDGWYATADTGDAATRRWTGPFRSRAEAAVFLVGARAERERPARCVERGARRLLRDLPNPAPPGLPPTRGCEAAFRANVPRQVEGMTVLHVEQWRPGDAGAYASALVVTRRGGTFATHRLSWADDNPDQAWHLDEGHYDLPTIERALWNVRARVAA